MSLSQSATTVTMAAPASVRSAARKPSSQRPLSRMAIGRPFLRCASRDLRPPGGAFARVRTKASAQSDNAPAMADVGWADPASVTSTGARNPISLPLPTTPKPRLLPSWRRS